MNLQSSVVCLVHLHIRIEVLMYLTVQQIIFHLTLYCCECDVLYFTIESSTCKSLLC